MFRNLIHFLIFSLPKIGEEHFLVKSTYKTKSLRYKKTEEKANCSIKHVHSEKEL